MAREYQNGDGFGYILAFKRTEAPSWTTLKIPHVESSRYVYYNDSLSPYSPFDVKIRAYNRRGEGPFSQIVVVHSAEEGDSCPRAAMFAVPRKGQYNTTITALVKVSLLLLKQSPPWDR